MLKKWRIHIFAFLIVVICELIGTHKITLGVGALMFLPMLYAMLFGGILSWPRLKLIKLEEMNVASSILSVATFVLIAKVSTLIGPSIGKLSQIGPALALQELGHFCGTVLLGLPVALFLGMKREAIGATFSIDRETSIALIAEKYGLDSPEGHGVIATYICGTLFGAIWIGLLAGYLAALKIFHPFALAMGTSVGSGSMMAAGIGAIRAVYPEYANEIVMYAGAGSLLITICGIYSLMFISLPLTRKFYTILAPIRDKYLGAKQNSPVVEEMSK